MIASIIGMMARDLEESVLYSRQREAFGKPIAEFGSIQEKVANMRVKLEAARLLQRQAAWMLDQRISHRIQASAAKIFVGETAVQVALDAVQIHGGWGYIDEYDVERSVRDAKLGSIGGGTSEIQRRIIARSLLGLDESN